MSISDEAVEAACDAHFAHRPVRGRGEARSAMRKALEAAEPHILLQAADYLEERLDARGEATNSHEQQYVAGQADAIAALIYRAREAKP